MESNLQVAVLNFIHSPFPSRLVKDLQSLGPFLEHKGIQARYNFVGFNLVGKKLLLLQQSMKSESWNVDFSLKSIVTF